MKILAAAALAATALLATSGCATVNKIALGAAEGSIAADWHSTMWAADRDWKGRVEANALLGPCPTPGVVSFYMAGTMAATAITYAVLPKWARAAVMLGITAVEISTVRGNVEQGGTSW